jgi:hypothetical protein
VSREFATACDYMRAAAVDPGLAIVPYQIAADAWGVTRSAIVGMVNRRKLEELRIEGSRFIMVTSINRLLSDVQSKKDKLRILIEAAAAKRKILFYSNVMIEIGMNSAIPDDRGRIAQLLCDISLDSHKEKGILSSVIVHRKGPEPTSPGEGFFDLAKELGYHCESKSQFIQSQIEKTWDEYS